MYAIFRSVNGVVWYQVSVLAVSFRENQVPHVLHMWRKPPVENCPQTLNSPARRQPSHFAAKLNSIIGKVNESLKISSSAVTGFLPVSCPHDFPDNWRSQWVDGFTANEIRHFTAKVWFFSVAIKKIINKTTVNSFDVLLLKFVNLRLSVNFFLAG